MGATSLRPLIGARGLVYALVTADTSGGTTYGTVYSLPNLRQITINPNSSAATLFADDGPRDSAETIGDIDVEITLGDINPVDEARILGHAYAGGAVSKNVSDGSPDIAIGFKALRSGKASGSLVYDYVWLYKGKLLKPSSDHMTKEASINYQMPKFAGKFVGRQSDGLYMVKARTDDDALSASDLAGFFSTVYVAGADVTELPATIAEGTSGDAGKVIATFEKDSSASFSILSASVTASTFMVVDEDGEFVPGAYAVGTAGTTVEVKFTPTAPFSQSDIVAVVLKDVLDTDNIAVTPVGAIIVIA